jgi:hypothetical protein
MGASTRLLCGGRAGWEGVDWGEGARRPSLRVSEREREHAGPGPGWPSLTGPRLDGDDGGCRRVVKPPVA